jgi:uncharacterized protein (TIGR02270 family)
MVSRAFIPAIADQLAETLSGLWCIRSRAVDSAHYRLRHVAGVDDRIEACLHAVHAMGPGGQRHCETAFSLDNPDELFAAALLALEARDTARVTVLCKIAEAVPELQNGVRDAISWVDASLLQGTVRSLLNSSSAFERSLGIDAIGAHGVTPGPYVCDGLAATAPVVRIAALRSAAALGLREHIKCALDEKDEMVGFWTAWSAMLLGQRNEAIDVLARACLTPGGHRMTALQLALQAMPVGEAHSILRDLAKRQEDTRWLLVGSGVNGDPSYMPWLIKHMSSVQWARAAGDAFALITGCDLVTERLDRARPDGFESGPNDNPDEPNVDVDPDDGLPWPDPDRIKAWWAKNTSRFQPGQRYFMGAPVTREHCIDVLKNGYQRQRILAAHYLCLLNPGTPLFNTSAPAWRQQKLLAEMK